MSCSRLGRSCQLGCSLSAQLHAKSLYLNGPAAVGLPIELPFARLLQGHSRGSSALKAPRHQVVENPPQHKSASSWTTHRAPPNCLDLLNLQNSNRNFVRGHSQQHASLSEAAAVTSRRHQALHSLYAARTRCPVCASGTPYF